MLAFGPQLYGALGGEGGSLRAALLYSNVVFAGTPLVWLMNALASAIRGTGNMFVPATAICVGVALLIPLSPSLIFGLGPFPALGIGGGGVAVVITTTLTAVVLGWYILSGRSLVRIRLVRPRWPLFHDILRVGGVGAEMAVGMRADRLQGAGDIPIHFEACRLFVGKLFFGWLAVRRVLPEKPPGRQHSDGQGAHCGPRCRVPCTASQDS